MNEKDLLTVLLSAMYFLQYWHQCFDWETQYSDLKNKIKIQYSEYEWLATQAMLRTFETIVLNQRLL